MSLQFFTKKIKSLFKDRSVYNGRDLHSYMHDYLYEIDDKTYGDLLLSEFSEKFDLTNTTCGKEVFNHFLRGTKSLEQIQNIQKDLEDLSKEDAGFICKAFSKVGKQKRGFIVGDLWEGFTIRSKVLDNFYSLLILNIALSISVFILTNKAWFFALIFFLLFNFVLYLITNSKISRVTGSMNYIRVICNSLEKIRRKTNLNLSVEWPDYKKFNKLNTFSIFMKDGIGGPDSGDAASILIDYIRIFFCFEILSYKNASSLFLKNLEEIHKVIYFAGYLDLLTNLQTIREENQTCLTQFNGEKNKLQFKNLLHPLLKNPVPQTKEISQGLIITGLNMSGKTTFMKTMALNQHLATSFGFCFATHFETNVYKILTSFAINDDMLNGKSRYYAEAYRLLEIKKNLKENNTICFVDEILSGTNSEDRIYGATKILEDFAACRNSIIIAATHDNQIAQDLSSKLMPVYFDGEISGEQINFDYLVKDGIVSNRNGLLILKLIGLEK